LSMRKIALFLFAFGALLQTSPAMAQATRTWVSGVGDDVNPCSRTAPCKTFAGAISKTAAGGEINALDPGGFGGVTITKSITISAEGVEGGVLVSGTNAIVVNGADIVVHLRGLDIEGLGTGLNGISYVQGAALHVENCVIRNFRGASPQGHGIKFAPSAGANELYVQNTTIINNGAVGTGGGVLILPSGAASVKAVFNNVSIDNNNFGLRVDGMSSTGGINVTVDGGSASGNTNASILSVTGGTVTQVMVKGTAISNNGFGPRADGASATLRFGNTVVTGNGTGLSTANGGTLLSYGNNFVDGNTSDGIAPSVIPGT
ncbi:MAG TPA: right-handed parallel beta-helix repeat-containing protein, partial [Thermoanaerobaculia bacterium]